MSKDLEIPQFILHSAQEIEGLDDDQRNHFTMTANWFARELVMQLAEGYPEALDVATKLKSAGKDAVAKLSYSMKLDLTSVEVLSLEAKLGLTPFKFGREADTVEDLRQLQLDWDTGVASLPDDFSAGMRDNTEDPEEPDEEEESDEEPEDVEAVAANITPIGDSNLGEEPPARRGRRSGS